MADNPRLPSEFGINSHNLPETQKLLSRLSLYFGGWPVLQLICGVCVNTLSSGAERACEVAVVVMGIRRFKCSRDSLLGQGERGDHFTLQLLPIYFSTSAARDSVLSCAGNHVHTMVGHDVSFCSLRLTVLPRKGSTLACEVMRSMELRAFLGGEDP
jgi:hypothetical protein